MKFIVSKSIDIDVAHKLPWHEGKCKNLHGHRLAIEVAVSSFSLDENDIVVDFGELKAFLDTIKEQLDHQYLNDIIRNPTAEGICKWMHIPFKDSCERWKVNPEFIRINETGSCRVEMRY